MSKSQAVEAEVVNVIFSHLICFTLLTDLKVIYHELWSAFELLTADYTKLKSNISFFSSYSLRDKIMNVGVHME